MKYNNFHAEKDTGHRCRWRIINHTKYLTRDWVANLSTLAHCKRLSAFAAAAAREKRNSPRSRVKLICRLYQSCNNNCNVLHTRPYYAAVGTFNGPWERFENRERRRVTPITTPFSSIFNWKIIPVEISKWKNFHGKTAQPRLSDPNHHRLTAIENFVIRFHGGGVARRVVCKIFQRNEIYDGVRRFD